MRAAAVRAALAPVDRSPLSPRARVGLVVVGFAIALTTGLFHVAERRASIEIGYQLEATTAAHRQHEEENRRLRLELSVLTSPARIESLARELGMIRPVPAELRLMPQPGDAGALASARASAAP